MKSRTITVLAAVIGAAASMSDVAQAESARSLVFWVSVADPVRASNPLSYRAVPSAFPAASASGWRCSTTSPRIRVSPRVAADPPRGAAASSPTLGESADLTCENAGATVSVSAFCTFSPADTSDGGHFTLGDAQGHGVELSIHCANNLPAASVAELHALHPGDALSVTLAVDAPRGEDGCTPPFTYDAEGTKHFRVECLERRPTPEGTNADACALPFRYDDDGVKHFKPECF